MRPTPISTSPTTVLLDPKGEAGLKVVVLSGAYAVHPNDAEGCGANDMVAATRATAPTSTSPIETILAGLRW